MNFYKKAIAGATPESSSKPFGMRDKLAYAAGDLGCNMSFALSGTYLAKFWTEYMGFADPSLSATEYTLRTAAIWSIIIILVKIWDAINDPIIGGIVDKIKAKPGQSKFKPWIFWGSFLLLFGGAVCFIPVQSAPVWVKILICIVGYLIWDMSYTLVNVPYGSMNSVISPNSEERAQLSTWRSIGSFLGNIVLSIGIPLFIYDDVGAIKGKLLIWVGLGAGLVAVACFQFLCRGTTERVVINYEEQKMSKDTSYFKSLGKFFTNKAAVSLTVFSIFQLLAMAFMQNYVVYYFQAAFPEYTSLSGIFGFLGMLPMFLVIPFATKIVKKFGKKEASTWPNLFGILSGIMLLVIPMEKMSPITGILIFTFSSVFMGLAISVSTLVCWAMVADCIDYQEIRTGVREEGVVYATYSLGRKLSQGIGASLVTALLVFTAFNLKAGKSNTLNTLLQEKKVDEQVVEVQGYVNETFVYVAEEDMSLSITSVDSLGKSGKDVVNKLKSISVKYSYDINFAGCELLLDEKANIAYWNSMKFDVKNGGYSVNSDKTGLNVKAGTIIFVPISEGAKVSLTAGNVNNFNVSVDPNDVTSCKVEVIADDVLYNISILQDAGTYNEYTVSFGSNGNYKESNADVSRANFVDHEGYSEISGRYISFDLKKGAKLVIEGVDGEVSYKLAEIQHSGVAPKVRIVLGLVYIVCFVAQFALLQFVYNLDKEKVKEIEAKLGRNNDDLIGENLDED